MTWAFAGVGLAGAAALFAFARARAGTRSFYESDVYGMTARSHWRFALLSAAFAAAFAVRLYWAGMPVVALLAVYTVILLLYAASFARGASDPDS